MAEVLVEEKPSTSHQSEFRLQVESVGRRQYTIGMALNRFSLRSLFFTMTVVAVICGGAVWIWDTYHSIYYGQVRTVRSALAEHPEIDKVWVSTNYDVTFEMEQLFFTVAGKPGVVLETGGIDGASKSEILAEIERALREQRPAQPPAYAEPWRWASWK